MKFDFDTITDRTNTNTNTNTPTNTNTSTPADNSIVIYKVFVDTVTGLEVTETAGVEFAIYDENGDFVADFEKDNGALTDTLEPGEYLIKETITDESLELYAAIDPIQVHVADDGSITITETALVVMDTVHTVDEFDVAISVTNEKGAPTNTPTNTNTNTTTTTKYNPALFTEADCNRVVEKVETLKEIVDSKENRTFFNIFTNSF